MRIKEGEFYKDVLTNLVLEVIEFLPGKLRVKVINKPKRSKFILGEDFIISYEYVYYNCRYVKNNISKL